MHMGSQRWGELWLRRENSNSKTQRCPKMAGVWNEGEKEQNEERLKKGNEYHTGFQVILGFCTWPCEQSKDIEAS